MPNRGKGARLYWHAARGLYVIRDTGRPEVATSTASLQDAEAALQVYVAARDRPSGPRDPSAVLIDEVLAIYAREHGVTVADPMRLAFAIEALVPFWGALPVSAVKGEVCRRYARQRVTRTGAPASMGTVRRELGVLRAALAHCHHEGYLLSAPAVTLPEAPPARDRWLTRDEVARLIKAARALPRGAHLARFILVGLYTGTRKDAILRLQFRANTSGGWIDAERGVLYRRSATARETKKRQTPARLPRKALAHLRRWARSGVYVVEYQGHRCGDIRSAWSAAIEAAGLPGITPHTLRHTAITWAMQGGARSWDAAGYFGTSVEMIEKTYGHHSPDHQESARSAMDSGQPVRKAVRPPDAKVKKAR